jgi:hypothetical protein
LSNNHEKCYSSIFKKIAKHSLGGGCGVEFKVLVVGEVEEKRTLRWAVAVAVAVVVDDDSAQARE